MNNIDIFGGDITTAEVDIIVNAANPRMLGGGGVDGAIHKAAGGRLLKECRKVEVIDGVRCPTGEARITSGGLLNAKYVIHTVGPRYKYEDNPSGLLSSCYRNSLDLVLKNNCRSVAFPALSCGAYGYPFEEAARVAFSVCSESYYRDIEIYFFLFGKDILAAWTTEYEKMLVDQ